MVSNQLLTTIFTYADAVLATQYILSYTFSPVNGRPYMSKVTKSGEIHEGDEERSEINSRAGQSMPTSS